MKNFLLSRFKSLENSLVTIIYLLIPIATLFSIMSDRNPYNYINIGVYGIISVAVIFYVLKYKSFKFDFFTILILLFNLLIFISQIVNLRVLEYPRTILLLSIFSIVIYQFFINVQKKDIVFKLLLVGGLLFAVYFVFSYRHEIIHLNFSDRLGAKFSDQNDLSKYLSLFTLISLVLTFETKGVKKIMYIVSGVIFFGIILLAGSISNLLCLLISILVFIILKVKRQNRLFAILLILALGLIFYLVLQLPKFSYFKTRIDQIFNVFSNGEGKKDGSALERWELMNEGFRLFFTKPLFGFGYDQVQYFTEGITNFSHNNFVELCASFGIFALIVYEAILLSPLIHLIKEKRTNVMIVMLTFYLFIFQVFLVIFRKKIEFILFPLFFSIAYIDVKSYLEVKITNKKPSIKLFFGANRNKKVETKVPHVLCLCHKNDETYIDQLKETLRKQCRISTVHLEKNGSENKTVNYIDGVEKLFWHRSLSLKIDEIKPDVVYVNAQFLSFRLIFDIGLKRKIVAFVNDDIDLANIYLSNRISYLTFSKEKYKSLQELNKKGKLDILYLNKDKAVVITRKTYICSYVNLITTRRDLNIVLHYFKIIHDISNDSRFAIMCSSFIVGELNKLLEKQHIDYIDAFEQDANINEICKKTETLIVAPYQKANNILETICSLLKKPVIYSFIPEKSRSNYVMSFYALKDDKQIAQEVVGVSEQNKNKKPVKIYEDDLLKLIEQYQYMCLF